MDCAIKIWDLRKFNIPLNAINDIYSLPLNCKFNHFYDQLILSSCNLKIKNLIQMMMVQLIYIQFKQVLLLHMAMKMIKTVY